MLAFIKNPRPRWIRIWSRAPCGNAYFAHCTHYRCQTTTVWCRPAADIEKDNCLTQARFEPKLCWTKVCKLRHKWIRNTALNVFTTKINKIRLPHIYRGNNWVIHTKTITQQNVKLWQNSVLRPELGICLHQHCSHVRTFFHLWPVGSGERTWPGSVTAGYFG